MSVCTGTVVTIDRRDDTLGRYPVWEKRITYACVTADTTATITLPISGILQKVIYKRPNTANDNLTSVLTIDDRIDNTIYTSATLAENDTLVANMSEPLVGGCDVLITFNEAVGSSATFYITLRGI